MLGVDILPTELPRESSMYFGDGVRGLLDEFVHAKANDGIVIERLSPKLVSGSSGFLFLLEPPRKKI